jgi:thiamine pyrophosphate-dependent acetolactate synthase large subunit-like protein
MYRVAMDQPAREDIAAAAAAHRELGREYDGAVAESLVERIGAEIDKRVDARLAERGRASQPSPTARPSWTVIILGLGSMGIGIGAAGAVLNAGNSAAVSVTGGSVHNAVSGGQVALVALIWVIIGIINVAYARRR